MKIKNVLIIVFLLMGVYTMANPVKREISPIESKPIVGEPKFTNGVYKYTNVYAVKNNIEQKFDVYSSSLKTDVKKPCIIFIFGGGFVAGTRDREDYLPNFEHFAKKGYVVISIDYRLGLKEFVDSGKEPTIKSLISALRTSVDMATEDMFDATAHILKYADVYGVDENLIVASGSSAGAIAALHSEYNLCNRTEMANVLPPDFRYAGVISYAGAIFSTTGKLKWANKPAPMLMFHGSADSNVPYNKIKIPFTKIGFYGTKHIIKQLTKMKLPYHFYDIENAAHEIADIPITKNFNEIESFLEKIVIGKQNINIHSEVKQLDKGKRKKVKLKDYITSNIAN